MPPHSTRGGDGGAISGGGGGAVDRGEREESERERRLPARGANPCMVLSVALTEGLDQRVHSTPGCKSH
eukprot:3529836-Prymnesium_polylepis.1